MILMVFWGVQHHVHTCLGWSTSPKYLILGTSLTKSRGWSRTEQRQWAMLDDVPSVCCATQEERWASKLLVTLPCALLLSQIQHGTIVQKRWMFMAWHIQHEDLHQKKTSKFWWPAKYLPVNKEKPLVSGAILMHPVMYNFFRHHTVVSAWNSNGPISIFLVRCISFPAYQGTIKEYHAWPICIHHIHHPKPWYVGAWPCRGELSIQVVALLVAWTRGRCLRLGPEGPVDLISLPPQGAGTWNVDVFSFFEPVDWREKGRGGEGGGGVALCVGICHWMFKAFWASRVERTSWIGAGQIMMPF